MEHKLQLSIFMLLIQVSLAVWQRLAVEKGQTIELNCPITNPHQSSVEWRNPEGYVMFFIHNNAVVIEGKKDKRYSISKHTDSEFTVSISDVTFTDGGNYTCSLYHHHTIEKTVEVTVFSHPRITKTKHAGGIDIKCSAEGNHYPPQIFWKLDQGPEILAHSQHTKEGKKYGSIAMLHVKSVTNRVTVKCLIHHPALHSQPLMNFVKIGKNSAQSRRTTTISPPTALPGESTTSWFQHRSTAVHLVTTDVNEQSTERRTELSTAPSNQLLSSTEPNPVTVSSGFPLDPVTSTDSHFGTSDWTSIPETTEETLSYNHTEGNKTESFNDTRTGNKGGSSLLVFLVTCLIFGLLVVVIFIAIKLRRAHIIWKRENEDSNPSEESSKSKSSQEERNSQGQRRRGFFNTAFAQYVVEAAPVTTSVVNTAAMAAATDSANTTQTSQPQAQEQTSAKCGIKETEL